MSNHQLLHLVIGGELNDVAGIEFRDLSKIDLVGAYPNYAEARTAWKSKAQSTVDNAHMRYFVIHAHRLLDPHNDDHHTDADAEAALDAAHRAAAPVVAAPAPAPAAAPAPVVKVNASNTVLSTLVALIAGAALAHLFWH